MLSRTIFFFQAEDGIRDLVRSRGLGDVYKRQQQVQQKLNLNVNKLMVVQPQMAQVVCHLIPISGVMV